MALYIATAHQITKTGYQTPFKSALIDSCSYRFAKIQAIQVLDSHESIIKIEKYNPHFTPEYNTIKPMQSNGDFTFYYGSHYYICDYTFYFCHAEQQYKIDDELIIDCLDDYGCERVELSTDQNKQILSYLNEALTEFMS